MARCYYRSTDIDISGKKSTGGLEKEMSSSSRVSKEVLVKKNYTFVQKLILIWVCFTQRTGGEIEIKHQPKPQTRPEHARCDHSNHDQKATPHPRQRTIAPNNGHDQAGWGISVSHRLNAEGDRSHRQSQTKRMNLEKILEKQTGMEKIWPGRIRTRDLKHEARQPRISAVLCVRHMLYSVKPVKCVFHSPR